MKYSFLLLTGFLCIFSCCKEPQAKPGASIVLPRDTTITPQNAYTNLFLDSGYVEDFIRERQPTHKAAQQIHNFYNARNYEFAWFDEEGLTVQAQGFWNEHNRYFKQAGDSTIYDQQLHQRMDEWLDSDTAFIIPEDTLHLTELQLTQHFFAYVKFAFAGKVDPEKMQWHIPRRKLDATALLDSLLSKANDENHWQPLSPSFHRLQNLMFQYYMIEKSGGWTKIIATSKKWRKGDEGQIITQIKKRLHSSGNFPGNDTSAFYTDSLETIIQEMERSFGLKEDGVIDAALIKELNVTVRERLQQMVINLERMKWMPEQPQHFIVANIPEYRLHVYENGEEVLGMDIIVGKAANRTVIFSNELRHVVFSPYWNIPRSIVRNEIVPAMRRSRNYLRRNNMQITGYSGGLPVVRQKPGPGNALGKVKFIFPNRYNIYFHDTPAKNLFTRDKRAFSHGCIRLQQPFELARYLLRNDSSWTAKRIREAMNRKIEKWVTLEEPVPVFITYFTTWVDKEGRVHFRDDVYGHDKRMAKQLFM